MDLVGSIAIANAIAEFIFRLKRLGVEIDVLQLAALVDQLEKEADEGDAELGVEVPE